MKFIRIILATLIIISITFTFICGRKEIAKQRVIVEQPGYKGVLTLWQIDGFEGGVGSRKQFLMKVARDFEKEHQGVLIMCIEHTLTSANLSMENGDYPDMISYSLGLEIKNAVQLNSKATVNGGMIGDKSYATAWCRGGYVIIGNMDKVNTLDNVEHFSHVVISKGENTNPLTALAMEGIKVEEYQIKRPMEAYVEFVAGKTPYLLGTQRDVNRLNARRMPVLTRPLTKYNDLYQYVSIVSNEQVKRYYSQLFVEYLTSEKVQKQLPNIGMLSEFYNNTYEIEHLNKMQKNSDFKTVSIFSSQSLLQEIKELSEKVIKGEEQSKNKIKNLLV